MDSESSEQHIKIISSDSTTVATRFRNTHLQEGGTVENVLSGTYRPSPDFNWYVLSVNYGREQEVALRLLQWKFIAYVPTHKEITESNGRKQEINISWLPNTLFLLVHPDDARQFRNIDLLVGNGKQRHVAHISYRYDHTREDRFGKNPPMTIRHEDMLNFMRLIEVHDRQTAILQEDSNEVYRIGEEVEVAAGRFKGVKGRVARFRKSNVVLVDLSGICLATTAYVPKAFLRPIANQQQEAEHDENGN